MSTTTEMSTTPDDTHVELGQVVHWHIDPKQGAVLPGIVSAIGQDGSVSIHLFTSASQHCLLRHGVQHRSVPLKAKEDARDPGRWSHRSETLEEDRRIAKAELVLKKAKELGVHPRTLLEQRRAAASAASAKEAGRE